MNNIVISVEHLYKQYRLGTINHGMLYKDIQSWWAKLKGKDDPNKKINPYVKKRQLDAHEHFWALKDISFKVQHGDVLGIIGRNGAGKSTLLKILSNVTTPTKGCAKLKGRIASLLEVGTGFHPELTGKENIYLNGTIHGLKRKEIDKKLDEIVSFSEIEKFIDTPVKRYSTGMYVRLAFAVAAHLEPEILIVDEVLAVGDILFQKKCLGKMGDVAKEGRTVLFVSHNMSAIERLCKSALLLENGRIVNIGYDVESILRDYVFPSENKETKSEWININGNEYKNDYFTLLTFYLSDKAGNKLQMPVRNDSEVWINIVGEVKELEPSLVVGYEIYTEDNILLYGSVFTDGHLDEWPIIKKGETILRSRIPRHFLNEGIYKIEYNAGLMHREWFCLPGMKNPMIFLEIEGGLSQSPYWQDKRLGLIAPLLKWEN